MSTLIGVNVKNSAIWLPRFLGQVERLKGRISRIVVMYGTSSDATFSILDHWRTVSKHDVRIYAEPNLPIEERGGAATLARVERDVQQLLKEGKEKYYLKLDADLVDIPENIIQKLVKCDLDVVAPYVWTEGRDRKTFFDVYGFRKDGCRFHPADPPGAKSDTPVPVDSVGTCFLAKRAPALAGLYANPYPLIKFCISLKASGFQVWAAPHVNVTHVDLERYGIRHYPLQVNLSNAPYLNDSHEQVTGDILQVETFYASKHDYDKWISENRKNTAAWIDRFNASRPLITASYKVLNESKFLEYSLRSVYPHVDRIDIIEGATKEAVSLGQANSNGGSLDDTVKIIKEFPDPEKKIRLIQGKFIAREQMQDKLLELCTSRWMLYMDGDEIISDGEIMRKFCAENLDGRIVHAKPGRFLNFWHDFHHVAYSLNPLSPWAKHGIPHAFLIWRDLPGLNFSAGHTVALDAYGTSVSTAYIDQTKYNGRWTTLDGVDVYHFGNAKGMESMAYKLKQVHPRLLGEKEDPWISGEMAADMVLEERNQALPEALQNHPERVKRRIHITASKPTFRFELEGGAYE